MKAIGAVSEMLERPCFFIGITDMRELWKRRWGGEEYNSKQISFKQDAAWRGRFVLSLLSPIVLCLII